MQCGISTFSRISGMACHSVGLIWYMDLVLPRGVVGSSSMCDDYTLGGGGWFESHSLVVLFLLAYTTTVNINLDMLVVFHSHGAELTHHGSV